MRVTDLASEDPGGRSWTRRALLAMGGSLAAGLALGRLWSGAPRPQLPVEPRLRLLLRTTFGPTSQDFEDVQRLGYDTHLEAALHPGPDPALEKRLARLRTLSASPEQLYAVRPEWVMRELVAARIIRAVYARNQLYERLVDFWSDHFNVYHLRSRVAILKTIDDREVIRPHVFGRFEDLLLSSARSPAMLFYLDNHLNVVDGPNENYARELLELHSLGVNGGYTQKDVEELARELTGWGFDDSGERPGHFRFRPECHDGGEKLVLGWRAPAGGSLAQGEEIIVRIARHPSTARHLATKLARHFIAPDPSESTIERIERTFRQSGGDLRGTYRTLFDQRSLAAARPKFKRPFHYFVDLIRKTRAHCRPERVIQEFERPLREMSHIPFQWKTPDGYPDEASHWAPMILTRCKFAWDLAHDRVVGVRLPTDPSSIEEDLFPESIDRAERRVVDGHRPGDASAAAIRERRALLWSAPSFQWG